MPEAFVSDSSITHTVSLAVTAGKLRKLASRLYSRNMIDPPEAIVARNLWSIVAGYYPGALIADRTALENFPASDGSVCLILTGRTSGYLVTHSGLGAVSRHSPPTCPFSAGSSCAPRRVPFWRTCGRHARAADAWLARLAVPKSRKGWTT